MLVKEDWERVHLTDSIYLEPGTVPQTKKPAKITLLTPLETNEITRKFGERQTIPFKKPF
jgi:hypothetical protein